MQPTFSGKPIASVDALARALGLSSQQLLTLAGSVSSHYRDFQIPKRDGSFRNVSGPTEELKIVQRRINRQLFERVEFPPYLFGSIRSRNYVQNAKSHAKAHLVLAMDVKDYFPSIKRALVVKVFQHFFNFPVDVAAVLADLCTKGGSVPQGACTSSYLANLALYDMEPRLVRALKAEGLTYSRLIDDISISSVTPISPKRVQSLVERVTAMLKSRGFSPKRRKTKVSSKANRFDLMEVTGLWLNLGHPRVRKEERVLIRKEVRRCILESKVERTSSEYHDLHNRTSGRVAMLAQLGHPEAVRYRTVLRLISPLFSPADVKKTQKIVAALCKTPLGSRATTSFIQRFHQARYRVAVVGRTHNELATQLNQRLSIHAPKVRKEEAIHG